MELIEREKRDAALEKSSKPEQHEYVGGYHVRDYGDWLYEGTFNSAGEREGMGTVRWTSGDRFEGLFKHGVAEGPGKYIFANGEVYAGNYSDNKPVEKTIGGVNYWYRYSNSIDFSSILGYKTIKFLELRSWKVGLAHKLIMLLIAIYCLIYPIFLQQGYLTKHPITGGNVIFHLENQDASDILDPEKLSYCKLDNADFRDYITVRLDKDGSNFRYYENKPCIYMDQAQARFTSLQESEFFIATRILWQKVAINPECSLTMHGNSFSCVNESYAVLEENDYYLADVESYKIKIAHGVTSSDAGITQSHIQMKGELYAYDHKTTMLECANGDFLDSSGASFLDDYGEAVQGCYWNWPARDSSAGDMDEMTIEHILIASGVQSGFSVGLDNPVDENSTVRSYGQILTLEVDYANRFSSPQELKYKYKFDKLASSVPVTRVEFKEFHQESHTAIRLQRYGILIKFSQHGEVGMFSITDTILNTLSAIVLVTMATLVLDWLLCYAVPNKQYYYGLRYVMSNKKEGKYKQKVKQQDNSSTYTGQIKKKLKN